MATKCCEVRSCERCGNEYVAKVISSRFCSRTCMYEWRKSENWEFIDCLGCGNSFKRRKNEKHFRTGLPKQFCSNDCSRTSIQKRQKLKRWAASENNHFKKPEVQQKVRATKKEKYGDEFYNAAVHDEFRAFRRLIGRAKHRKNKHNGKLKECSITVKELDIQWKAQNGKCVYTGVNLILPHTQQAYDPNYTASLDRIDSTKGYVPGNIQFVSIAANYAKNKMTHEQMLEFCRIIKESN